MKRTFLPALLVIVAFAAGGGMMWALVGVGVVPVPKAALSGDEPHGEMDKGHGEPGHTHGETGPTVRELGEYLRLPTLPNLLRRETSRIIYLNREGVTLLPGADDASRNRSSIVRGSKIPGAEVPAFTGSQRTWTRIVRCLQTKFAPFDVVVTDRRPMNTDNYIMATFGGTSRLLGRSQKAAKQTGGLAPFNSNSIPAAVVFIFSATLRNHVTRICETAGMEVAHAYGLDHGYHCRDLMTYKPRCGPRRFVDKTVRCGEGKPRDCANGKPKQNSYRYLIDLLGPRPKIAADKTKAHR